MKKLVSLLLLALFATLAFSSCSVDDNEPNYHFELIPVESVILPESFVIGKTYEIKVYYRLPTNCHYYDGFYYEKDLNTRTFALQTKVVEGNECGTINDGDLLEAKFDFFVNNNGSYIFKFYTGEYEGSNSFLEYEIPVLPQ